MQARPAEQDEHSNEREEGEEAASLLRSGKARGQARTARALQRARPCPPGQSLQPRHHHLECAFTAA